MKQLSSDDIKRALRDTIIKRPLVHSLNQLVVGAHFMIVPDNPTYSWSTAVYEVTKRVNRKANPYVQYSVFLFKDDINDVSCGPKPKTVSAADFNGRPSQTYLVEQADTETVAQYHAVLKREKVASVQREANRKDIYVLWNITGDTETTIDIFNGAGEVVGRVLVNIVIERNGGLYDEDFDKSVVMAIAKSYYCKDNGGELTIRQVSELD